MVDLSPLRTCSQLDHLDLNNTNVDDDMVKVLAECSSLKADGASILLDGTCVCRAAITSLENAGIDGITKWFDAGEDDDDEEDEEDEGDY